MREGCSYVIIDRGGIITEIIHYDRKQGDSNEYPYRWLIVDYISLEKDIWIPKEATQ